MNGINLSNADHREAVKESKEVLGIVSQGEGRREGGREGGREEGREGGREGGRYTDFDCM